MCVYDIVKEKRKMLGISQKDFADALGLGKNGEKILRAWENGEICPSEQEYEIIKNFAVDRPLCCESVSTKFTFIDLFAGIGGIRIPFQEMGGKCVFTSEWDKFAQKTYRINFGDEPFGDITKIPSQDIPEFDVLLGGFPCQPFSQAGLHKGISDTRGTLFFEIQRILSEKRPKAFLLENVKQLVGHDKGRTFKVIIDNLESLNYSVHCKVLRAGDFGVPQNRQRIYIVGFNKDFYDIPDEYKFPFPEPTNISTRVGDILEHNVDDKYTISDALWSGHLRRKASNQASGKGFGYSLYTEEAEYTNTLSARYYKDGSEILIAQSDGKNPRKLTPRECARLQGFPDSYIIPVSDTQAYKQFGNSVAVPVIRAIAKNMVSEMNRMIQREIETDLELKEDHSEEIVKEACREISNSNTVVKIEDYMRKFSCREVKNNRNSICIAVMVQGQKMDPIVVPRICSSSILGINDFYIICGKDATEIYGENGVYLSKLKSHDKDVRIIRIDRQEYSRLKNELNSLLEVIFLSVETTLRTVYGEQIDELDVRERNIIKSKIIQNIFKQHPSMGRSLVEDDEQELRVFK